MRISHRQSDQGGFTLLELLITVATLAIVAQAFLVFIQSSTKATLGDRMKAEAYEHAIQMLEELRGLVLDDNVEITVLDDKSYNDGRDTAGNPILKFTQTTKKEVTHPGGNTPADYATATDRLSGNPYGSNGFAFVRNVEVVIPANDQKMRQIHVRVWRAAPNSPSNATPTASSKAPLAEVIATVRSLAQGNAPAQVLDVYLVALESVPGWWSRTSNLIPLMRASLISLQSRNPGLVLRPHWIRRMSYGRDLEYTPELNNSTEAKVTGAFKKAYVYPGLITYSDSTDYYYLPSWFKARVNIDGVIQTDTQNYDGYPLADQFNHAMRLPDELNLYAIHQTIARNRGAEAPEISLRMLLEKMNDPTDSSLTNSIVINLHGEMLPALPLRNYSDAAKDPDYYWSTRSTKRAWRAVTHPEALSYASGADVAFRTYAYDMQPDTYTSSTEETDLMDNVTLFVPNATFSNLKEVRRMEGSSTHAYAWISRTAATWNYYPNAITYTAILEGSTPSNTPWYADQYTPPGRDPGLRIVFRGVTTTARAFNGPYVP